ncbi:nucleotidyltransferase family protein [Bacillus cereus]|nr:nucleotidyltransferase family protein [Bacillus cereus]
MLNSKWEKEEELLILSVKKNPKEEEINRLKNLLNSHLDWSKVIGLMETHRTTGIAWNRIKKYVIEQELEKKYTCKYPHFYKFLKKNYFFQKEKAGNQIDYTATICNELTRNNIPYVLLKGLVLSLFVYEDLGARNFNDNDILVHPEHIDKAINIFKNLGYTQGVIKENNTVVEVGRKEKVIRTMTSHEVIPLVKLVDEAFLDHHIIDLHFSINLMSKNRNVKIVEDILESKISLPYDNSTFYSMNWSYVLLFLSIHFYKEAVSFRDLNVYKDLLLYKINDLVWTIESKSINWRYFLSLVQQLNFEKEVYFTFYYTNSIFSDVIPDEVLNSIKPVDTNYLNHVYYYDSNEIAVRWNNEIHERFFDMNRPSKISQPFYTK